jgi:predicted amidophosphoribosyltransferase
MSTHLGINVTIENNLLIRALDTGKQALKDRKERIESAKEIFKVDDKRLRELRMQTDVEKSGSTFDPHRASHITFIIIDDVITTGSTMKAAIETLQESLNRIKINSDTEIMSRNDWHTGTTTLEQTQTRVYGLALAH